MRLACSLALIFALSACGEKIVSTPTPVACVKAEQIPAEPAPVGPTLTGDAVQDSAILAVRALELLDYAGKLRALIEGCK